MLFHWFNWYLLIFAATIWCDENILEPEFPPEHYDERETGKHHEPQDIELTLWIESIIRIDANAMEFIVYSYINQEWLDERLKRDNHHTVVLQDDSSVWVPDLYCINCRKSSLTQTDKKVMLRIDTKGQIYYSQPGLFYAACKFKFQDFPFDVQKCNMEFTSYSYNNSFLRYRWKNEVTLEKTHLEQFIVEKAVKLDTNVRKYNTGNFTVLSAELRFTRQTGFYLIRLFIPSAVLVCLSWVAFYISPTEVGDRLAIGITLILSMIFLLGYVDSSLPKVSYVKAIDWYLIMALIMIVGSVIETIICYAYVRRKSKKKSENEEKQKEKVCNNEYHERNSTNIMDDHKFVALEEGILRRQNRFTYRRSRTFQPDVESLNESIRKTLVGNKVTKASFITKVELSAQILFPTLYGLYNFFYIYHYVYKHKST